MDDKKIARINELSATAKERELTEEEHAERAQLRAEYVAAYKQSLVNHLNNVKIVDDRATRLHFARKRRRKMKNTKLYAVGMAIIALLGIISRLLDKQLAKLLFKSGNFIGGLCEIVGSAIPFALCAFCFATLMFCRHTRTTRTKNKMLTVVFGAATLLSSAAAIYIPLREVSTKNYYAIAVAAAVLTALFISLGATLFKNTYQKILMTKYAKIGLFASAVSVALFYAASFIPRRASYSALQISMEKFGNYDSPEAFVPFLALSGIGAALVIWTTCFTQIFPKLKFSKKIFVAFSAVFAVAMLLGSVSSGNTYASEFLYGLAVGYTSLFLISSFIEKKECF